MRWRQLFKKETIPGWLLVLWDRLDHLSRIQFVWQSGDWLVTKLGLVWSYVRGSAWVLGIVWLTVVVLWPDIKKKIGLGAGPKKAILSSPEAGGIDDAANLRTQIAGLRATNDHQATLIDSYEKKLELANAHARWENNEARTKPILGITLHKTVIEDYVAGLHYPRKLRLYLSNDGPSIELGKGKWIAEGVGLQIEKPPTCEYQTKNHLGQWSPELSIMTIPSGKWFRLYVGIDSTVQEPKLKALANEHELGILQIPATVDGADVVLKIRP